MTESSEGMLKSLRNKGQGNRPGPSFDGNMHVLGRGHRIFYGHWAFRKDGVRFRDRIEEMAVLELCR